MLVFYQLRISMEHHGLAWSTTGWHGAPRVGMESWQQVSIDAPSHTEACFRFKLGLRQGARTHNRNSPWHGFEPRFSWLLAQCSTTELFRYFPDTCQDTCGVPAYPWHITVSRPSLCHHYFPPPSEHMTYAPSGRNKLLVSVRAAEFQWVTCKHMA